MHLYLALLFDRHTGFGLLQDPDDLLLREFLSMTASFSENGLY